MLQRRPDGPRPPYPLQVPIGSTPVSAVGGALEVIAGLEPDLRAFAYLDPDRARDEARRVAPGPLSGITVGVKDIFDTADQPTEYGSPIYAGHRPAADAALVAMLRRAGAVVLGKTVTTEFAWSSPGATRNPHRADHTPGGSSSGSAAGAAVDMFDLGVGSQTAGSVIRPASFCGVFGLKPTIGAFSIAGARAVAPSLDTVGFFARDLEVIAAALSALRDSRLVPDTTARVAFLPTDRFDEADQDCRAVVVEAARLLHASERGLPAAYVGLTEHQELVQAYEGRQSLLYERANHPELLSAMLRARLEEADAVSFAAYADARRRAALVRDPERLEALFGDADVLVTPAAVGEAPASLEATGDARFNRLWTLLGCPALTVPGALGESGLPIGVQLVARPFCEDALIGVGRRLQRALR